MNNVIQFPIIESPMEVIIVPEKKSLLFAEMKKSAQDIQDLCADVTVIRPNEDLWFTEYNTLMSPELRREVDGTSHYPLMSDHAFSQLCAKLALPTRYIKKCLKEGRSDIAQDNINSWLEDFNKPILVRLYNNQVRGILSDKFSILDSPDILDVVEEVLPNDFNVIKGFHISPERLHLRVTSSNMLDIEGEDLFAGIQIDSSDVGRKVLTVRFMIYKQVCTNGLILSQADTVLFEQRHIGITSEDFKDDLVASLSKLPELIEKAEETIRAIQEVKLTPKLLDKALKDSLQALDLTEEHGEKIMDLVFTKYHDSNNAWALINGITEIAQSFSLDRRIDIETYAGNLLTSFLPKTA